MTRPRGGGRACARRVVSEEAGAAAVAVVGILAVVSLILMTTVTAAAASAARQQLIGASDASALAAADAASGFSPGTPCGVAGSVAAANGAALASCRVEDLVVTVALVRTFAGTALRAVSTAGPGRA